MRVIRQVLRDARPDRADDDAAPSIPGYRTIRWLGQGGQGRVWLAIRERDSRRSAVKVLFAHHGRGDHARARFDQSIAALAALDHPGIVRSLESGVLPTGELWHATEHVPGLTLVEYVNHLDTQFRLQRGRESRLPIRGIIELFVRICEAVEAAHRVGVIHRDLKPSNIIVDDDGQPRLLDFGHAKLFGSTGNEATREPGNGATVPITITGEFIGSPAYASPEQVQCRPGTVDVRADVYAIGVMLYQCLTGTFPYDVDGSLARTFEQIQYVEPTPPRLHAPWIDRDLQAIVLTALAKLREDRYQSAGELRGDLQRYLRGEAVAARRGGGAYAALKFVRRHRVLAASVGVVLLVTVAYAASMTVLYRRATRAEADARAHAAQARQQYTLARETLDFVISQIETRLDRVAGTRELRESLLHDCYEKLQVLTELRSDDPQLRADLAAVHKKLGSIASDLHLLDEAAGHWEESLRILESLNAAYPDNADYLEALSIAYVLVGDIAKGERRWSDAGERYRRALEIDERLAAQYHENDRLLDNLAWSYERMAGREWCPDEAARKEWHRKRHEVALELVARKPDNPVRLDNLCTSHMWQTKWADDRARFLEHVAAASELADRLVAAEPLNAQYAMTFAMASLLKLDEPLRVGDVDTARSLLERIIAVADAIRARDPDGRWAKTLQYRAIDARETLRQLQDVDAPTGQDLRWTLPKYEDL